MKRLNKALLVALVLGVAYLVYSAVYWSGANAGGSDTEQLGAALATALVAPHLALTALAVIFNALALFLRRRAFALVAGILYAVAMVLFLAYAMFVVVEMVLCFVAYARMPRQGEAPAKRGAHAA